MGVQIARGFVSEDEVGIGDESSGDRHALFLAPGELPRVVRHAIPESHHLENGADVLGALAFRE